MAKYIKIPVDFFDHPVMQEIAENEDGDSAILLYLELLCAAHDKGGVFRVGNIALTDHVLQAVFRYNGHIADGLGCLELFGLIKRNEYSISVFKFWADQHDRSSQRYKDWRLAVFARDGFICQKCGSRKNIQAHHIKAWKSNKELRYEVNNGITLCRRCHLEAHGGCWRNG